MGAFTLVELLVVLAVIATLAGLLLPSIAKSKNKGLALRCLNNHRQLTLAWRMYSDDNQDRLLFASEGYPDSYPYVWVRGYLDFDPANRSNWDVEEDIKKSPLWPYCGQSTEIWKCPSDKSAVMVDGVMRPRVRSMSMNVWVGGFGGYDLLLSGGNGLTLGGSVWRVYLKANEMIDPGPSRTFILLDMREDSIDIGNFAPDMRGWPDSPDETGFYDLPASYHNRAGGLSFADGHAEIRRWVDPRTTPALVKGGLIPDVIASPNNPDVIWLQERSTRKLQP
jgi:prepilin-type N-terminal cleavage/methylation domain-containing protein/prepilin-type processing-associated H-X9-DG protein